MSCFCILSVRAPISGIWPTWSKPTCFKRPPGNWRVLEDNDPTGYKSGRGEAAKTDVGIQAFSLPKRSPDLNPLDFSFWAAVNKKMRQQEKGWPKAKRESRTEFLARLRRTATKMPTTYITRIIGALERRCQQVVQAKGGHFAEGS